jgi:hypothetical protein
LGNWEIENRNATAFKISQLQNSPITKSISLLCAAYACGTGGRISSAPAGPAWSSGS